MNVVMELRKCCNHPFLISGAEEQLCSEELAKNAGASKSLKSLVLHTEKYTPLQVVHKLNLLMKIACL
jgi:hypothetical protein